MGTGWVLRELRDLRPGEGPAFRAAVVASNGERRPGGICGLRRAAAGLVGVPPTILFAGDAAGALSLVQRVVADAEAAGGLTRGGGQLRHGGDLPPRVMVAPSSRRSIASTVSCFVPAHGLRLAPGSRGVRCGSPASRVRSASIGARHEPRWVCRGPSDAQEGLKAAIARVLGATWQRCRVHWMRNALAHVGKAQQSRASAALRQAFLQPDQAGAMQTWRQVADQLRPRWPKLGVLMDDSEHDVLATMAFPAQHRTKLHSVNTLERLNKEVKRRADVVGIFPSEASIIRLVGAVLLEANDEWQMQHRTMGVEAMGHMLNPPPTIETLQRPPRAA